MYGVIIIIHVVACLILIASILLQAGRGGGLSEVFSGAASQTIFGARASTFLTRATTVAAIIFLLTCISLTVFSSRRGKSLFESKEFSPTVMEEHDKSAEENLTQPKEEKKEELPSESEAETQP
jgi:preprotein translocase subunit SecG